MEAGQVFEAPQGTIQTGCGSGCRWNLCSVNGPWQLRQSDQNLFLEGLRRGKEVQCGFCTFKGSSVVFLASSFLHVSEASLGPGPLDGASTWFSSASGGQRSCLSLPALPHSRGRPRGLWLGPGEASWAEEASSLDPSLGRNLPSNKSAQSCLCTGSLLPPLLLKPYPPPALLFLDRPQNPLSHAEWLLLPKLEHRAS